MELYTTTTSSGGGTYSIDARRTMGIDKARWDAAGEALEALFKTPRNKQFCTILRDLLLDARNHIHGLEKSHWEDVQAKAQCADALKDLATEKEMHEEIKREVEVRRRIQHELRAIILLAINPE